MGNRYSNYDCDPVTWNFAEAANIKCFVSGEKETIRVLAH